jgi:hypothetical protein
VNLGLAREVIRPDLGRKRTPEQCVRKRQRRVRKRHQKLLKSRIEESPKLQINRFFQNHVNSLPPHHSMFSPHLRWFSPHDVFWLRTALRMRRMDSASPNAEHPHFVPRKLLQDECKSVHYSHPPKRLGNGRGTRASQRHRLGKIAGLCGMQRLFQAPGGGPRNLNNISSLSPLAGDNGGAFKRQERGRFSSSSLGAAGAGERWIMRQEPIRHDGDDTACIKLPISGKLVALLRIDASSGRNLNGQFIKQVSKKQSQPRGNVTGSRPMLIPSGHGSSHHGRCFAQRCAILIPFGISGFLRDLPSCPQFAAGDEPIK